MNANTLAVWLGKQHIGTLNQVKNGARFQFDESICQATPGSPCLSTALPVQGEAFNAVATRNWFSGLLPEDARLDEVRRFFGIEGSDYLSVLEEVGWECAGAVSILPENNDSLPGKIAGVRRIDAAQLSSRLSALPAHPFDDASTLRISLGGYQEKLCVDLPDGFIVENGRAKLVYANLPLNGALSTHILKPQPSRFPGLIEGEAWAMVAASYATSTARVALLDLSDAPQTLLVERFDRKIVGNHIERIHQEDCAQALGVDPARKYAAASSPKKSDPSFRRIAALLGVYARNAPLELERLLRQMVVTVVLGNTDAHAKNFAFLHPDTETIALSPLYDVVPASEITPGVVNMGMRIDGRIRLDRIEFEHIAHEAKSWGMSSARIIQIIKEATSGLREGIEHASLLYPSAGTRHAGPALERLGRMRASFLL
ncbi:MAG: HipA domain-containing protein [Raoultibacter sp.]